MVKRYVKGMGISSYYQCQAVRGSIFQIHRAMARRKFRYVQNKGKKVVKFQKKQGGKDQFLKVKRHRGLKNTKVLGFSIKKRLLYTKIMYKLIKGKGENIIF